MKILQSLEIKTFMSMERPSYENPQILPLKETAEERAYRELREKFEQPERIDLYEGAETLNVRDIQPEQLKTEVPTVWMKGWGTTSDSYKDNILGLAERGRRVLAVDNVYGVEGAEAEEVDAQKAKELGLEGLMLDKVIAYLKMLDMKEGLDKVDVVAHSEGAIHAIYAAMLRPDRFRSLVLVDPAGMVGEDNWKRLISGAAIDVMHLQGLNLLKREGIGGMVKKSAKASKELFKSVKAGYKEAGESIGIISKTKIHELLEMVRAQGIKVSIVHGVDDKFFNMEDVQEMTEKGMIDGFYSTKGTHNEVYLNPRPYTTLIDQGLDSLEKLHEKEAEKKTERVAA